MHADAISALVDAWRRSQDGFWGELLVFVSLASRSVGMALVAGIPVGMVLSRTPRVAGVVIAPLALVQTVPSLALLGLAIPWLGIGQPAAIFAAVLYSLFPIVLNTYVGITGVAPAVRDAARGMGMTDRQILWSVELPLALPVMLAGIRTGAVYAVGVVTVCALAGAGGLGDYIVTGLTRGDDGLILLGALPILVLTLLLFWGLGGFARLARRNSTLGLALGGGLVVCLGVYAAAEPLLRARRPDVVVGSKNFTEGRILSEIIRQMLVAHSRLRVGLVPNMGNNIVLQSLRAGTIDVYPEYTGNLLTGKDALGLDVPADKARISATVRQGMQSRFHLVLLDLFGLNNTYALCVPRATAERDGLQRISDLAHAPELRVVVDLEFLDRPDGWRGLALAYGLHPQQKPRQISPDLLYRALEGGEADVVCGFATDWQIDALDLVVLADDRGYFPLYHAAPLVREALLNRHPEVRDILNRLVGRIDDVTMRRLNAAVALGKRSEEAVAREFLAEQKLLGP